MSKRYTAIQLKDIVREMLNLGFASIDSLSKELIKINLTKEEAEANDPTSERLQQAKMIISMMTVVNDVIHPGHSISLQLFPKENHNFIGQVIKQQETNREKGLTSKNCGCCREIK